METHSLSFAARHEADDVDAAASVLQELEGFRTRLGELFETTPWDVAVVLHRRPLELALAQPWLPLARLTAAPAGRRYFVGWFGAREIHVLAPAALARRASSVPGSLEALRLAPLHEYTHLVVGANNPGLPPPFRPRTFRSYVRWAWLCEGAATYLSGQSRFLRPAIARRLREGGRPSFPPSAGDALLLGGSVFELLELEAGRQACVALATRLHQGGPHAAIENAFRRPVAGVERDWRAQLEEVPRARASSR